MKKLKFIPIILFPILTVVLLILIPELKLKSGISPMYAGVDYEEQVSEAQLLFKNTKDSIGSAKKFTVDNSPTQLFQTPMVYGHNATTNIKVRVLNEYKIKYSRLVKYIDNTDEELEGLNGAIESLGNSLRSCQETNSELSKKLNQGGSIDSMSLLVAIIGLIASISSIALAWRKDYREKIRLQIELSKLQ